MEAVGLVGVGVRKGRAVGRESKGNRGETPTGLLEASTVQGGTG